MLVFVSSVYSLCMKSEEFSNVTNIFRKRVFRLNHYYKTEAEMTSEPKPKTKQNKTNKQTNKQTQKKRANVKELSPETHNQSNKQSKPSCLVHTQS